MRVPLSAFYFSTFGALGAFLPFLPLLLQSRGLEPRQISHVMLLLPIMGLIVPSIWGMAADRFRARIGLLRVASFGCAATILLLIPEWGVAGSMLALATFNWFRAPVITLVDAAAHAALPDGRHRFASIRIWGSIGFALCAWGLGELDASHHPIRMLSAASAVYLIGFVATLFMRGVELEPQPRVLPRTLAFVARSPLPLLFLGTLCHYVGQSMFDVYFGLHMRALGHDDGFVGLGWSVGVMFEIIVMFFAPRILAVVDARRLLVVCTAAAILRWTILSAAVTQPIILVGQSLHALTFGLWYLSMVKVVQDEAPDELRTSVQGLAMTSMGCGMVIGYLLGGALFEAGGGGLAFQAGAIGAACATACYGLLAAKRLSSEGHTA